MLSNNIHDYRIVSQGMTQIPDVDDAAEWVMIDVRLTAHSSVLSLNPFSVFFVRFPCCPVALIAMKSKPNTRLYSERCMLIYRFFLRFLFDCT